VHDYHRIAEVGVLGPEARVDLIDGKIINMAPIGKDHQRIVDRLNRTLVRAVGDEAIVRVEGSIRLSQWSEPGPDLVLLAPRMDFYRTELASAADTLLVIEVSDSTLRYDRDRKVPLYDRHHVPEVWVVDMQDQALLVYGYVRDGRYERQTTLTPPAKVAVSAPPGVVVDVASLFEA
jgi:Uma2 family endonuclease